MNKCKFAVVEKADLKYPGGPLYNRIKFQPCISEPFGPAAPQAVFEMLVVPEFGETLTIGEEYELDFALVVPESVAEVVDEPVETEEVPISDQPYEPSGNGDNVQAD